MTYDITIRNLNDSDVKNIVDLTSENEALKKKIDELTKMVDELTHLLDVQTCPNETTLPLKKMAQNKGVTVQAVKYQLKKYGIPFDNTTITKENWERLCSKWTPAKKAVRDAHFHAWSKLISQQCHKSGKKTTDVMKLVYNELNRTYGIVWCDVMNKYGCADKLHACYVIDTMKYPNLVTNILHNYL